MSSPRLQVWLERDGALLRLRLARPKANIVDAAMIAALHAALDAHRASPGLRGVLLDAEGPHFSFGASVEEHLADRCAAMLASLHALILAMVEFPLPILVAVRGQCLGGGLEVALAGGPIFAAPGRAVRPARDQARRLRAGGQLPAAAGASTRPRAEDLLWSGRSIERQRRRWRWAWCSALADDPEAAALAWFDEHLAPRSAAALACAVAAVRAPRVRELRERLAEVERLYLDRLMNTRDANEGLAAFLARRTPAWEHR